MSFRLGQVSKSRKKNAFFLLSWCMVFIVQLVSYITPEIVKKSNFVKLNQFTNFMS